MKRYEDVEQLRSRMSRVTPREVSRLLDILAETRDQLLEVQPGISPDDQLEAYYPTIYKEDLK